MTQLPALGGFYEAADLIVNAQSCVNLFPENQPQEAQAPTPVALLVTPGTRKLATVPVGNAGTCRCSYRSTDDQLFQVIGQNVWFVDNGLGYHLLGTISSANNPCYMQDNGVDIILVDGTASGYTINLASHAFATIVDPDFYGGDRIDICDGYFVLNKPGTRIAYISGQFATTFDSLDFFAKAGYPDPLTGLIVLNNEIWLLGTLTSEVFANSGQTDSIFQRLPGAFQEHGCAAPYSICKADVNIYWLSQDKDGNRVFMQAGSGSGYKAKRISNHGIEAQLKSYTVITDCIGMTHQSGGHLFIVFTFPTQNVTWVYDEATQQWHQRAWLDSDGNLDRWRPNNLVYAYDRMLAGDFETGDLLEVNANFYDDDSNPIPRIRRFAHIDNEGKRVRFSKLIAKVSVGEDPDADALNDPQISLRYSDDGGHTWGNARTQSMGFAGQYNRSLQWNRLGMARDRVFEVSWANKTGRAMTEIWYDAAPCGS